MSYSYSDPPSCCSASAELKLYQAFIFSVPIFFTFILLLLFYIFYLRRRRVDWASLRMRSSMHDDANHTSGVCFPFFISVLFCFVFFPYVLLPSLGFFYFFYLFGCLENVRKMERTCGFECGVCCLETRRKGGFLVFFFNFFFRTPDLLRFGFSLSGWLVRECEK